MGHFSLLAVFNNFHFVYFTCGSQLQSIQNNSYFIKAEPDESAVPLGMANVVGVFYVLGIGVMFALFLAFIAITHEIWQVSKENEVRFSTLIYQARAPTYSKPLFSFCLIQYIEKKYVPSNRIMNG